MDQSLLSIISHVGFTIDFMGKILVSFTAISVHNRFWKEHKIDDKVFEEMKKERTVGILGISLMVIGFILEMISMAV